MVEGEQDSLDMDVGRSKRGNYWHEVYVAELETESKDKT